MDRGPSPSPFCHRFDQHAVLQTLARDVVEQAKRAYARDGARSPASTRRVTQACTWSRSRRVVIKVAVSDQGVNTRFVVTDMEEARPKGLYQHIYCARGQAANESKAHTRSLQSDRTSVIALRPISSGCFCSLRPLCYSIPCAARCSRRRPGPVRRWRRSSSTCSNWEPVCKR